MSSKTATVDLTHAGAGTTLLVSYLSLIPGVLPTLAIAGLITAVLLPVLVLGLAAVVLVGPPYGLWRLATRSRVERNPT